jgi:hypothetical protein
MHNSETQNKGREQHIGYNNIGLNDLEWLKLDEKHHFAQKKVHSIPCFNMDPPEHSRQSRADESHADPKANNKCIMHSNFDAFAFTCICIKYEKTYKHIIDSYTIYTEITPSIYVDFSCHLVLMLGGFNPPGIRFMRF